MTKLRSHRLDTKQAEEYGLHICFKEKLCMYVLMNAFVKIRVDLNIIFCFDKSIKNQVTKKYFTKTEYLYALQNKWN